ncbi:hypothetical protein DNU06_12180 [Putridiphycobacter roseus]|uniref:histidine kinase n=1 Tax=Putridiphycobacter roseus TaxID=2219161 RepID=A0A2W1NBC8_9FLAO|nr:sensor histidine kinase [Putridiphycobacter roseus]PZE16605.1 hypothetical protein DNU06_12180 [Putridiphycobacter roseus]
MKDKIKSVEYSNLYKKTQIKLITSFNVVLLYLLPLLAVILFFFYERTGIPTITAFLFIVLVYINLKVNKNYFLTAKLLSITGLVLCQYTLLFFPEIIHFVDPMWILVIVFFTYFTLGKNWGTVILFLNIIGVCWYIIFLMTDNLNQLAHTGISTRIGISINFIICALLITYMMMEFIKLNKNSENNYREIANSLKEKNKEKTVLLKEVHHRVKNNLQVIISLLRLQLHDLNDENLEKPYNESINRVMAMSLIHEKIYQSSDLAKIDLENYIHTLTEDLISSYSVHSSITFAIESKVISVSIKSLVPMALLFNELISNSIMHGFKDKKQGEIKVKIWEEDQIIHIYYMDNGGWIKNTRSGSLGLELITSLTEQLNGEFERKITGGTTYKFQFQALD